MEEKRFEGIPKNYQYFVYDAQGSDTSVSCISDHFRTQ